MWATVMSLGGHHALQAGGLDHGSVVHPVALGHHFADALLLGIEGGDQVILVPAGEGHESVVVGKVLRGQQLLVGAVPVEDQGAGEPLREPAAVLLVVLHQGDPHPHGQEHFGQIVGDAAAANEKGGLDLGQVRPRLRR